MSKNVYALVNGLPITVSGKMNICVWWLSPKKCFMLFESLKSETYHNTLPFLYAQNYSTELWDLTETDKQEISSLNASRIRHFWKF